MDFPLFIKLLCFSSLYASVNAGPDVSDDPSRVAHTQLMDLTRPSPISEDEPRQTGGWLSPEYKWFFEYPLPIPPVKTKTLTWTAPTGQEIDYYEVEMKSLEKQIYPNLPATPLDGFDGIVPGPTFVMQKGREAVVRFTDSGPENLTVHVHGQFNRSPFDGWAGDVVARGQYKDYYYPNAQDARTLWYHDHVAFHTGEHNYHGEEGFYYITDSVEQSLGLPSGQYDVPLLLSAKIYNSDGTLNYDTNHNFGLWGDVIQVNGQPWPHFQVEPRKYRFRLLNAAVSRTFDLTFGTDAGDLLDFDVIASDGGLFGAPVRTNDVVISIAERYEIVIDFANYQGQNITLLNELDVGENVDYAATDKVMRFIVGDSVSDNSNNGDVPSTLREQETPQPPSKYRDFKFARTDGYWTINGVGFKDVENRILARPELGTWEQWTLRNGHGGATHPVHIHLVDFKVLSRTGGRNQVSDYEAAGWKDVVWLAAGEKIDVVARYAPWPGIYLFHCHNFVHEDHDMLVEFSVPNLEKWGYTNNTLFINPLQPEFQAKNYNEGDYTAQAINDKIAWLWSTNPYNHGNVEGVYAAIDAYEQGGILTQSQAKRGIPRPTWTTLASTSATPLVSS